MKTLSVGAKYRWELEISSHPHIKSLRFQISRFEVADDDVEIVFCIDFWFRRVILERSRNEYSIWWPRRPA